MSPSNNWLLVTIAVVVAVAISVPVTLAAQALFLAPEAPAKRPATPAPAAKTDLSVLDELAALREQMNGMDERWSVNSTTTARNSSAMLNEINDLRARLSALEAAVAVNGKPQGNGAPGAPTAPGPVTGRVQVPGVDPAVAAQMEAVTRATLQRVEQERIEEMKRQQQEMMAQQRVEREKWMDDRYTAYIDRVMAELGPNAGQIDQLRVAIAERKANMMKLYDPEIADEDKKSWQDTNAEFDQKVQGILSQGQYQVYKEKRLDDFSGNFGQNSNNNGRNNGSNNPQPRTR